MSIPNLKCPNCGASASLPLGMTCADHRPVPIPDECTCYLGHPDDPDADEEACAACDREYWENPVLIILDHPEDHP